MHIRAILPYALVALLAQAALDASPALVALREGGMGLGSALIAAQLASVAALALGAAVAVRLAPRAPGLTLVGGALAHYAGFIVLGMQPMHALLWVVAGMALLGAGQGALLTMAFLAAADTRPDARPLAIALLVPIPILGAALAPWLASLGNAGMTLVSGSVVAAAVVVARLLPASSARRTAEGSSATGVALAAAAAATGLFLVLAAADPSRVTAVMIAGFAGVGGIEGLDAVRAALALLGLLLAGAAATWWLRGTSTTVRVGAAVAALAAVAMTGIVAVQSPRVLEPAIGPVLFAVGFVVGAPGGGWWLARGGDPRPAAAAGTTLLAIGCLAAMASRGDPLATAPQAFSGIAMALVGAGGALAVVASRLALAEVAVAERALAAGAGVAAVGFATALGSLLGGGERVRWATSPPETVPIGGLVLLGAAVAGVVAARLLTARRPSID